ncbi:M48 family metalloprotease [Chitinimonas sp. PSY-7]|uniref:M48 family metalloprotease n=1 Tax=Chitinimonas sp. PSY-7 TaxID=3459088 RepID=UPI0040400B7E
MRKLFALLCGAVFCTALVPVSAESLKDILKQGINEELQKKLGVDGDTVLVGSASWEQERAIGQQVAGRLLGQYPLVADAKLQQYVNKVGRWVAQQSDRPDLPWVFGVIDSPAVNAFAMPGGYVFVSKGLYQQLASEAELAGVLGHEIAHVQQKHQLKLLRKGSWLQAGSAVLGKELKQADKADAVIGKGAEILARKLDQGAEFESDRIGIVLAARAGYDPMGLTAVLQKIDALAEQQPNAVELLFTTHPSASARLEAIDTAMGDKFESLKGSQTLPNRLVRLK